MNQKVLPLIIILVAIAAFLGGTFFTRWQSQESGGKPTPTSIAAVTPSPAVLGTTIGDFSIVGNEVCLENGKPVVYFFGSSTCPHCQWEHPIFERVAKKFAEKISFHNNMDNKNDLDVFQKYMNINRGSIPFILLGCRYTRVGSGELMGEKEEEKILTTLFCKLTGNEPSSVCQSVASEVEKLP